MDFSAVLFLFFLLIVLFCSFISRIWTSRLRARDVLGWFLTYVKRYKYTQWDEYQVSLGFHLFLMSGLETTIIYPMNNSITGSSHISAKPSLTQPSDGFFCSAISLLPPACSFLQFHISNLNQQIEGWCERRRFSDSQIRRFTVFLPSTILPSASKFLE